MLNKIRTYSSKATNVLKQLNNFFRNRVAVGYLVARKRVLFATQFPSRAELDTATKSRIIKHWEAFII